jgi:hypothetical protein
MSYKGGKHGAGKYIPYGVLPLPNLQSRDKREERHREMGLYSRPRERSTV